MYTYIYIYIYTVTLYFFFNLDYRFFFFFYQLAGVVHIYTYIFPHRLSAFTFFFFAGTLSRRRRFVHTEGIGKSYLCNMPPKGYVRRAVAAAARRDFGVTTAFTPTAEEEEAIGLPAQLQQLQKRREALESHLETLDLRVYDLETVYLRQYVELGGCLFDGFGLERQQQWGGVTAAAAAGSQAAAYRARLHSFSPSDRVFTASSVGALGTVERLKTMEATGEGKRGGRRKRSRTDI
ncbi:hypothetical protein, conserved [Trypanosoma cruzi]|uniref:Chromatin modification-related protein EAF6 n=2 Tax=Trypanosoma cruzi TaxID=5693 RepID=Q4DAC3_TRYCC|nr:hypothetical protein, conserved [Trypanosoma cruzi]EAN89477.1 hypothetical protein, conserved [Trypanosoma cruzi]|eukprot:XP_811328.1 hypothetical protein [Trypanosoma cruzi strain CL Brener]